MVSLKTGSIYKIKAHPDLKNIYQIILYGFTYLPFFARTPLGEEEPSSYDCLAELERMGVPWERYIIIPNANGSLSSTYPKYFVLQWLFRLSASRYHNPCSWKTSRSGIWGGSQLSPTSIVISIVRSGGQPGGRSAKRATSSTGPTSSRSAII